jgi:hypothetical protein
VQRALRLATVHVDVPGKRVGAKFRDRSVDEADRLVEELASRSRGARRRESVAAAVGAARTGMGPAPTFGGTGPDGGAPPPSSPPMPPVMGPGWFADPTRRHQARYWDGTAWTENVIDAGVTGVDPP